ncbi:hypothetical protein MPTK2_1g02310 [Marchantia polymorpha subsp. ruderalis]
MWKSFSLSETDDYTNVASPNHPIMASPTCHGVATVYRSSRKVVPSRNAVDDRSRSKYIDQYGWQLPVGSSLSTRFQSLREEPREAEGAEE